MINSNNLDQLFKTSPLLEWLPDETLFSLISRVHYLSGHHLSRQTSKTFFGNYMSGIHHDFPNFLHEFEQRTHQLLGTAQEIANEKTLLKYYRSFMPLSNSASIADTMCSSSVAHLKFRLGLITSRFRANHPLKACPACMADDRIQHGWTYWHLQHQFPGVWWCEIHDHPLYESLVKSTGVRRFQWYLPCINELRQWLPNGIEYPENTANTLKSLMQTVKMLVDAGSHTPWNTNIFWKIYRNELSNRGWTKGQRLRFTEMAPEFIAYSKELRTLPELSALPTTVHAATAQLGRLLRKPRSGTHPLRHIILVNWLYNETDDFLSSRKGLNTQNNELSPNNLIHHDPESLDDNSSKKQVIELLTNNGTSMRKAAEVAGVDINVVMAWAADANITISRRPKKLKPKIQHTLIKKLCEGHDKTELAIQLGISVTTINRTLRTVPELQHKWYLARFNFILCKSRSTWNTLIETYPQLGTKLLRSMEPAVYIWLYRNDRDWLRDHSPRADVQIDSTNKKTMWDKRDTKLSTEVKRTVLLLSKKNPQSSIRLWQLYQLIPELKAKLDVLDKLPLTKLVIEQTLSYNNNTNNYQNSLF